MWLKIYDSHLTYKVANKCRNVRERVQVVEWNKRWSPPFRCCPVSCQCPWKKTLIEKQNVNVEESCLNDSKLHLNHKRKNTLCQNINNPIHHYWSFLTNSREIDIANLNLSKDIDQILFDLKSNNPSNFNFAYLNINSVRNKFENF